MNNKFFPLLIACGLLLPVLCATSPKQKIRKPALAGSWYPSEKKQLKRQIDSLFQQAKRVKFTGNVRGLISPHAGYAYSGRAAAAGYLTLKGKNYTRVIILAPSHYNYFRGGSIANVEYYRTPLGDVPLDRKVCDRLIKHELFIQSRTAHTQEHSIEIQLPLLQEVLADFKIIPILIGRLNDANRDDIVKALKPYVDSSTLVIASSDFTHQGPRFAYQPYKTNLKVRIPELDHKAFQYIKAMDAEDFNRFVENKKMTICGYKPIGILIKLLKRATPKKIDYYTSADVTGDWNNSVSYFSIAFIEKNDQNPGKTLQNSKMRVKNMKKSANKLNETEKATALKLARDTLNLWVKELKRPENVEKNYSLTPSLKSKMGVFVTLNKKRNLRGCIGYVTGRVPLYEGIIENTINASSHDPRFNAVRKDEIDDITIEISAMTPLTIVESIDEIEVGIHGLMMEKGFYRGLLLPQVATEWGWDREEFLENTCRKAGMNKDCWKDKKTIIKKFSAQVFGEE